MFFYTLTCETANHSFARNLRLQLLLLRVEFGQSILSYFHKQIYFLSDSEFTELILIMKNPFIYNKKRYPNRVRADINNILKKLHNS